MRRSLYRLALALFFVWLVPVTAYAVCTDFAAPDVNWRRCLFDGSDLAGVQLNRANLRDASFKRADLTEADLSDSVASRAKFVSASMKMSRLDGADLTHADFTSADLTDASLEGASLRRARLFHAIFHGANLTGVILEGADLLYADFSGATWIDGTTICAEGSVGRCRPQPRSEAVEGRAADDLVNPDGS